MTRFFKAIDSFVEYLVAAIFLTILLVGGFQVFARYVMNFTPSWSSEVQIFGHIYIVFLAIPIAYLRGSHLYMDSLRKKFPKTVGVIFSWVVDFLWAGFGVILVVYGWKIMGVTSQQMVPGMGIPMSYPYAVLPISGSYLVFMVVRTVIGKILLEKDRGDE